MSKLAAAADHMREHIQVRGAMAMALKKQTKEGAICLALKSILRDFIE